jgi:SPP1 gp7 family putative phage head morphogenesis protein
MKTLAGQDLLHTDYSRLLADVDALLWEIVYKPIVDIVRPALPKKVGVELGTRTMRDATPEELRNSLDSEGQAALKKALQDGAVQMIADHTGRTATFAVAAPDRRISDGLRSFGAKLDKQTGLWHCPPAAVPSWVRSEAGGYAEKMRVTHDQVKRLTDALGDQIDHLVDEYSLSKAADHAIDEVAAGWKKSAKGIEVMPNLGPAGQAALVAGYERTRGILIRSPGTKVGMTTVLELSTKREIKVWAHEALARLRAQVDENALQGYRSAGLAQRIRDEYGVSKNRADLIARQETNNFMSNYREARARDAGLKRYVWYAAMDARTRKDHKALHGLVFRYDRPPITDTRTGARNNPGQDFRCRCNDLPVIE